MFVKYRYSENEIKDIFKTIEILVDTREQKNNHILSILKSKKINFSEEKLDFGDYSFRCKFPDQDRYIYFNKEIVIERKNSLEELSNNFTDSRTQFENELLRKKDTHLILLIEDACYPDIFNGNYKTQFNKKSFVGSLFSFCFRYNMQVCFIDKFNCANFIFSTFYYYLREYLK